MSGPTSHTLGMGKLRPKLRPAGVRVLVSAVGATEAEGRDVERNGTDRKQGLLGR